MTKILKFTAKDQFGFETQPKPYPAAQALPKWWKDMTPYDVGPHNPDGSKLIVEGFSSNATFKKCTPMRDGLTSGYIIPLWTDVQVRIMDNGEPRITWRVEGGIPFELHGPSSRTIPSPAGYSKWVYKYLNTWIPHTPKGYSTLWTTPFAYQDTPFRAVTGVIDSDSSQLEIAPPMWLKEGFEGIVEKGTPLLQVIPFKRDNWETEFDYLPEGKYQMIEDSHFNGTIIGHYIKNHWSKKSYK
jgi:hypothetical protein